jgi:hypothetical protein
MGNTILAIVFAIGVILLVSFGVLMAVFYGMVCISAIPLFVPKNSDEGYHSPWAVKIRNKISGRGILIGLALSGLLVLGERNISWKSNCAVRYLIHWQC